MKDLVTEYRKSKKDMGIIIKAAWEQWKYSEVSINAIRSFYGKSNTPIIVPVSGNRNSRALARVIYEALKREKNTEREIHFVHVSQQDVIVSENVPELFGKMKKVFLTYPVHFHVIGNSEDFYVQVIGKGIPTPKPSFWWCGQQSKVSPFVAFTKQFDSFEILSCKIGGKRYEQHPLGNRLVYKPFSHFTNEAMWKVFLHTTEWGDDIGEIFSLYEVSYDTNTPIDYEHEPLELRGACSTLEFDSSFACWYCTYHLEQEILKRFYMKNNWVRPLLKFRQTLQRVMMRKKIDGMNMQRMYKEKTTKIIDNRKNYEQVESETTTYKNREFLLEELLRVESEVNMLRNQIGLPIIKLLNMRTKDKIIGFINEPVKSSKVNESKNFANEQLSLF